MSGDGRGLQRRDRRRRSEWRKRLAVQSANERLQSIRSLCRQFERDGSDEVMKTPQTRVIGLHLFERWKLDNGWLVHYVYDDDEAFISEWWLRIEGKKIPLTHYVSLSSDRVAYYLLAEKKHIEEQVKCLQSTLETLKAIRYENS